MNKYYCGVDVGSNTAKAVVIDDSGKIKGKYLQRTGGDSRKAAEICISNASGDAGIEQNEIVSCIATGYSRKHIKDADSFKTEITCHAKGVSASIEGVRTIIDIGGQDSKVISLDNRGKVLDFAMNDKCAAGSGRFLEVICMSLDIDISKLGELAVASKSDLALSNTCTVFAESEVISLVSEGQKVEDISRATCRAIATRVASLAKRVGLNEKIAMSGGVAKNIGIIEVLKEALGFDILVPENPQFMGAYGAALFAKEENV